MATSSLSALYGRCFLIFMASIILIEGILYLAMAIYGLAQENCNQLMYNVNKPFQFATDMIYFINEDCSPELNIIDGSELYTVPMTWRVSELITFRMYVFLIVYCCISALWIIFSLLVIFAMCGTITSTTVILFFWPWFISVIAGSINDVVAAGFFIEDITHTTTASSALDYIGADVSNAPQDVLSPFNSYFVTPPIVMTCISLRLGIIWLLNVFGAFFCISLVRSMIKKTPEQPPEVKTVTTVPTIAAATVVTATTPTRENYPPQQVPQEYPTQIAPKPLPIQTPTQTPAAYQYQQPEQRGSYPPQSPYSPYPQQPASPQSPQVMAVVAVEKAVVHTPAPDSTTYRNTETHPDRLNYPPSSSSMTGSGGVSHTPAVELATDSVLNNRYSVDPTTVQNQNRVSDELRSQLPWSYTSMLIKPPPPPRKPQVKVYPDIPEPDYVGEQKQSPQDSGYSRW